MVKLPLKTLIAIFVYLFYSIACYANMSDTLENTHLAMVKNGTARAILIKEANVLYPDMIEGYQDYFIEYVEKFALSRRAYLQRTYIRSKKFFPKASIILRKHNVPAEFVVLLALESAFNANAVSSAGAVGYWQIMDEVAKEFGLKIIEKQHKIISTKTNKKEFKTTAKLSAVKKKPAMIDERKNFQKSTHAAARYLKDRMRNLNDDMLLVAASYNWGVGNVWNVMQKTGKANPTFWDIKNYLPAETKAYVMNFIALNVIFNNYENFMINNLCFKEKIQGLDAASEIAID